MKQFRGGLVFKAHGLLHHSTLCWIVIKKKKRSNLTGIFLASKSGKEGAGHPSRSRAPCAAISASHALFRSRTLDPNPQTLNVTLLKLTLLRLWYTPVNFGAKSSPSPPNSRYQIAKSGRGGGVGGHPSRSRAPCAAISASHALFRSRTLDPKPPFRSKDDRL